MKIAEKKVLLEKIEHKLISDQISEDIYQKHSDKIRMEIAALYKETEISQIDGSNLEMDISRNFDHSTEPLPRGVSAEYEQKQRL